ncbi:MAG: hypothetical protein IKH80_08030 [Bacteroidaceae bacterium]|nr:hypothetical protein [Bacteroidaceae bacterium]
MQADIDQFLEPVQTGVVDKKVWKQKMVDKAIVGRETGRYFGVHGR